MIRVRQHSVFTNISIEVLLVCLFIFSPHWLVAQPDLIEAEYYFDHDPGHGNATPLSFTQGTSFDITLDLVQSLETGHHVLGVRAKDSDNVWGFAEKRDFFIPYSSVIDPPPSDISAVEYFIDYDPGFGSGTPVIITQGQLIDLTHDIIDASTLPAGYHLIVVRAMNIDGVWGHPEKRMFYIPESPPGDPSPADITQLEYFFDIDPGFGNATAITITEGQLIDINEIIPQSLEAGYHQIYIRAKNADGVWSPAERRPIYIPPTQVEQTTPDITRIEYFIDGVDPGIGNATELTITPDTLIDLDPALIPTEPTLIDGQHTITFRAMNDLGQWSMAEIDTFDVLDDCTHPIAAFDPQMACAGQPIIFADSSKNVYPTATYRWYLNGDAIVDDTTSADVSYTYTLPGTYVVALAIRQGTICFDSITTTIDVQPLPVAIFSTTGNIVDKPVYFSASASNLPTGAYWEWDFNEDGVVDGNTEGNTNYTYNSVGVYNPTLTITDGLGCGITVTNTVAINNAGTGEPSADFLANNGCIGNTISFVDLSQYIPDEAIYSWDFDGDGTEDSATKGNQTYTYTTSGSYNATLSIDLGGSSILAAHTLEIVDIPVADFSADNICEGSAMAFTDLSTNIIDASVYMWDFNNDGVIDSNAKTNISYNYSTAGTHVVSLSISNGHSCTHSVVKQVEVISMPVADFTWETACAGEKISFHEQATGFDPNSNYQWDFNSDGTIDATTDGDAEHIYLSGGAYNVTLTVANPAQCTNSISKSIEIIERPIVDMDVIAQCYGQESQMNDLSLNVSPGALYSWDFNNDGTTDDTTVGSTSHIYTSYGSYVVNLTVDNGNNCSASAEYLVNFADAASPDFTINKACKGEEVVFTDLSTDLATGAIYSWDFNGDSFEDSAFPGSTAFTFNNAGQYDATLTIDNGGQCMAYKTLTLDITPPPSVDLGPDQLLCVEGTVTLDAGAGYSAYLWPDGSTEQTYTIDQVGDYMVRVEDAKSCINTDTISIQLLGDPVPSFEYSVELSLDGMGINFINTSIYADTYSWDFGDGNTSSEFEPNYVFSDFYFYKTSVFHVCLYASNLCGHDAQYCEDIYISPTQFMEEGEELISVYPNPASQYIFLELKEFSGFKKMGLFDAHGKIYWQERTPMNRYEVDLNELSKGIYYFILEQNDKYFFKRFVKN